MVNTDKMCKAVKDLLSICEATEDLEISINSNGYFVSWKNIEVCTVNFPELVNAISCFEILNDLGAKN